MARLNTKGCKGGSAFTEEEFDQLMELAVHWEVEANKCAKVQAFYGACILAGASIEAMLLAVCDLLPDEVRKAKANLKLRTPIARLGLDDLLRIATDAKWLLSDSQDTSEPDIQAITDIVRRLRNLSHPGRHLRELKQVTLPPEAFQIAWDAIDLVRDRLAKKLKIELPDPHRPTTSRSDREPISLLTGRSNI